MIQIFDLDDTVIDSTHRQLYDTVTGDLNIDNWLENCTPEKIAKDKLLPLAGFWHDLIKNTNDYIMVCTARFMQEADYVFLNDHGLFANKIFSRREAGPGISDAKLKVNQLRPFFNLKQFRDVEKIMYDDNFKVREAVRKIGITAIHPKELNAW